MPKVGHYEASIFSNGRALREYDPPEGEESDDIVKYIEAHEGSAFEVHIKLSRKTRFLGDTKEVTIEIDGVYGDGFAIPRSSGGRQQGWVHKRIGRRFQENGSWVRRRYVFKKLLTTDEVLRGTDLQQIAQGVGSIRIKISDARRGRRATPPTESVPVERSVPEKALKGQPVDLSAGFGDGVRANPSTRYHYTTIGKEPVVFVLKYRSKRALQMLELIPITPEPQPLEDRDINTLDLEEARQLLMQYREQETQATSAKKEATKVKIEESFSFSTKSSSFSGGSSRERQSTTTEDDADCMIVEVKKRRKDKQEVVVLDST